MLTPLDIESKEYSSSIGGYSKSDVKTFMKEVLASYERMYKENIEMKDKINMLNEGIQYYKTIEDTLQNTLLLAEKTAEETKASARVKAEGIEKEAEIMATKIINDAKSEVYRINQIRETLIKSYDSSKIQIKQFLKTQLELIGVNEVETVESNRLGEKMIKETESIASSRDSSPQEIKKENIYNQFENNEIDESEE